MAEERSRTILLYLTWLGTLCGALLLILSDVFPVRLSFVRPETLFVCLTEVEVAFLLFAWPLFIPSLKPPGTKASLAAVRLLGQAGVLLVAALPLELIAANVSSTDASAFFGAQALLLGLAAFAAAIFTGAGDRGWRVGPWYILAAFVVSAFLPFLRLVFPGADLSWMAHVSPFWAAAVGGSPGIVLAAIAGGLAAALVGAHALVRKGSAA